MLLQWEASYLTLFPESVWRGVLERLLEFRRRDPEGWTYVREITTNAIEVTPDKQGRILIPAWLQAAASLKGKVILTGMIDRIEVWDPEKFKSAIEEPPKESDRFRHQIFG